MTRLTPLIVILGPTASGKTGLALALAKKWEGELVNADSRQIYEGMDIATNKLVGETMTKTTMDGETVYHIDGVPLHLLDIITPHQGFSLAEYKIAALKKIEDIQKRGKLPILVGGTGLYISSIVDNLTIPKAPADMELRSELAKKDTQTLFNDLEQMDPTAAESIGSDNKRKLIRALEVCITTGTPFSSQQKKGEPLFDTLQIGLHVERAELYAKIDERVDRMIASGLIEEAARLSQRYADDLPAMTGIGYREILAHLRGEIPLEEAVRQIKFHTHQYARRQITWWKRDQSIQWVEDYEEAEKMVERFLKLSSR